MSVESDNARQLAKLIIDQGLPHIEDCMPPLAISERSLGIHGDGFEEFCNSISEQLVKSGQTKYQNSYKRSLRTLIFSFIAAGFSFKHLALGTNNVRPGSYLYQLKLSRRHIETIRDFLVENDYIIETRSGYRHASNPRLSRAAQYYPTAKLLEPYCELLYAPVGDFTRLSPYTFASKDFWEPNWKENCDILVAYNNFMSESVWAKKAPTGRKLGKEPYTSGRVYTHYQNITQRRIPIRQQTLLNGEKVCEVDFKTNHLWLLSSFYEESLPEDPYEEVARLVKCSREEVKRVITPTLGASSKRQLGNIKYTLHDINDELVDEIINSTYTVMPWLERHRLLFRGVGSKLQFVEGAIAIRMFRWAVADKIPMINVHDAYAVSPSHGAITFNAMHEFRNEVVSELGFLPHYF